MQATKQPPTSGLTLLRTVAWLLAGVMTASVIVGLASAPAGAVAELGANVWGRVTIIDLYLAFAAICAWIVWREPTPARGVIWTVLVITTGSAAVWVYVALATTGAPDVRTLLLGRHIDA